LVTPFLAVTLPPNDSIHIPIRFLPNATGTRQAALVFSLKGKASDGSDSTWTEVVPLTGTGVAVSREVGIGSVTVAQELHSMAGNAVTIPVVVNAPIDLNAPDNGTNEAYGYRFTVTWKRDAFQYSGVVPTTIVLDSTHYDNATEMETRYFHYQSSTPLTGITTLATLNVQSMLSKSDTTGIQVSSVAWLDQYSTPLCYVSNTTLDGSHVLDPVCGDQTLQTFLVKGVISVDGIRPNPAGASAEIDYSLAGARSISVSIYDMLGNEVKRLMDMEPQTVGAHVIPFTSEGLSSGAYYCRITDGHFVVARQFEIAK
jgi:hypothetical protein